MSEHAAAVCRAAELAALAVIRFEAEGLDEAQRVGAVVPEGDPPGDITDAILRPEPRA